MFAFAASPSSNILRSRCCTSRKSRVLWPDTAVATRSGTPARTMFLTAVRRKIVEQLSLQTGCFVGGFPGLANVSNGLAVMMEHIQRHGEGLVTIL
jgi:hypothetical protein